jgi:hypothetical protein
LPRRATFEHEPERAAARGQSGARGTTRCAARPPATLKDEHPSPRLTTVTPPPPRAPRAPFAAATCAPSVPHETVGSVRPCRACPACTSLIFVGCASLPGTACATLRALLCPARAPRGSTRGPRGAGGSSGPWRGTRTCSAHASWPRKERAAPTAFIPVFTPW